MVRRSARIKAKQLMLEREQDTVKVKVTEDVSPREVAAASEPNAGAQDNIATCSNPSGSLSILSPREEALQNPVILQHLLRLCPAPIVASCRLVCKQWYEESLAIWRTSFPFYVMLQNKDIFLGQPYFYNKCRPPIRTPLKEFLDFIDKPENQCSTKPYRSMELSSCRYNLNYEGFNLLWKAIGSNLTALTLTCYRFSRTEDFRRVIFKCCPVLQKLKVSFCQFPPGPQNAFEFEGDNGMEYQEPLYGEHKFLRSLEMNAAIGMGTHTFPVSWIELFSHFPLLTSLNVSLCGAAGAELEVLMEAIKVIRRKGKKKLPFKRFKFYPCLAISPDPASHHHFALAKELHLPFTNCSIRVHPELDQPFMRNALDYLAPSLRTIDLVQGEMNQEGRYQHPESELEIPPWFLGFPFGIQLNNLTDLRSRGNSCGTFTFLKYAPNLSMVDVVNPYPEDSGMTPPVLKVISNTCKEELANVNMLRMKHLRIMELNVSDQDLQSLFEWMPNITDLGMVLNQKQLRMVCENWKYISSLSVYGIPLANERITRSKTERKKAEQFDLLPVIENLKCLEYFSYEGDFTPEYVFNLFLRVPTLQTLSNEERLLQRKNLDMESYQQAIEDNVLKQWMADNRSILE